MLERTWTKEGNFHQPDDEGYHHVCYVDSEHNAVFITKWGDSEEFTVGFQFPENNGILLSNVEIRFTKSFFDRYIEFDYYWFKKSEKKVNGNMVYSAEICTADLSQIKFFIDDINHFNPLSGILDEVYSCFGIKRNVNPALSLVDTTQQQAVITALINEKDAKIKMLEDQVRKLQMQQANSEHAKVTNTEANQVSELIRQRQQADLLQQSKKADNPSGNNCNPSTIRHQ